MRFLVTVRKLNVTNRQTDRQTDGQTGGVAISPVPGPTAPAGDNYQQNTFNGARAECVYISVIGHWVLYNIANFALFISLVLF